MPGLTAWIQFTLHYNSRTWKAGACHRKKWCNKDVQKYCSAWYKNSRYYKKTNI